MMKNKRASIQCWAWNGTIHYLWNHIPFKTKNKLEFQNIGVIQLLGHFTKNKIYACISRHTNL